MMPTLPMFEPTPSATTLKNSTKQRDSVEQRTPADHDIRTLLALGDAQQTFAPDRSTVAKVQASYESLKAALADHQQLYGLHTHFGHNVDAQAKAADWREHQQGLIDYLSVGEAPYLPHTIVRRGMRLQAMKLGQGFSGVHPHMFAALVELSRHTKLPPVPKTGSLGASGDLIPMAHAVSPLFGPGKGPYGPRDGLALTNTDAMMISWAVEIWHTLETLWQTCIQVTAQTADALLVQQAAFAETGLTAGLAEGKAETMRWLSRRLMSWRQDMPEGRRTENRSLQPRYSLRCAPQVLHCVLAVLESTRETLVDEATSVADNPVVLPHGCTEGDRPAVWHGGKFYTVALAQCLDQWLACVVRLSDMLDRQITLLVTPDSSEGLPANLALSSSDHVKGIHQLASAHMQRIRSLGLPSYLCATPAESNNQDILPGTMTQLDNLSTCLDHASILSRAGSFISSRAVAMRLHKSKKELSPFRLCSWKVQKETKDSENGTGLNPPGYGSALA